MQLYSDMVKYLDENIIPRYSQFDNAHNISHVKRVLANSISLSGEYDASINMVYLIAVYHDVGLIDSRKNQS